MAFGFLKKKEFADIIYMNGHIYTQDPAFPWASAVACKNDRILAVGDFEGMGEITGNDTIVVDLNEKYMFPGFIDAHGTPVLKAFEEKYLSIDSEWDVEPIYDLLSDYVDECDSDVIFGYGFNEKVLDRFETAEDAHRVLDEIESERPVLLLGISGAHFWVNSLAAAMIAHAAEEDALDYLTTSYILNVFAPLDFDEIEHTVREHADTLTDKGITAFFNASAPDYFTNLYLDSLLAAIGEGEGDIKQRFLGSTYINRPFNPQLILHRMMTAKTNCLELNNLITADFVTLELSSEEGPGQFSDEALRTICLEVAEKGFHIHVNAKDKEAHEKAAAVFDMLRDKGYRNHTFVLASMFHEDIRGDEAYLATWPTESGIDSIFTHAESVQDAIDELTIIAAELVGMSNELGSIEKGKRADFTVFDENPLTSTLSRFAGMHAEMTIVDGIVVYDAEEAAADEMCDMLFGMQV